MRNFLVLLKNKFVCSSVISIFLLLQFTTRWILSCYSIFHSQVAVKDIFLIFFIGSFNDLITAFYLIFIIIISGLLKKILPFQVFNIVRVLGYIIGINILIFVVFSEILFWDEFGTRFNFIAVDYIVYTHEIIGTIKESLPSFEIIFLILISINIIIFFVVKFFLLKINQIKIQFKEILLLVSTSFIFIFFSSFFYISDYIWIKNRYVNELAKNGYYEFFAAFRHNSIDYLKFYPLVDRVKSFSIIRDFVKQNNQVFTDNIGIERKVYSLDKKINKYNIVLIVVESLNADFMGYFGNLNNLTPKLDDLINKGIIFTNFYATGTRTVRGLEAITLSMPPVPGASIIKRFNNDNMFNIANVLEENGYKSIFLYGGFGYIDNLSNFFSKNHYSTIDRINFSKEEISFSNIWGISDEDLFNKAIKVADSLYKEQQPFFLLTLTSSNHRPYTFPQNKIDILPGSRSAAVKYSDYAIGKFIDRVSKKKWFDNTIFIITADHCATSTGRISLPIKKYHIPLIFYAPKILISKKNEVLSSQIDIAPSILSLLNIDYKSKFWGQDLFTNPKNRALITTYQLLGYLKDDYLVILSPKKNPLVQKIDKNNKQSLILNLPQYLVDETISLYQESYLLFNNKYFKNKIE